MVVHTNVFSLLKELSQAAMVVMVAQFVFCTVTAANAVEGIPASFTELTGTALAVFVLAFFIHYFMRKERETSRLIETTIKANTNATRQLTLAILESSIGRNIDRKKIFNTLDNSERDDQS